MDADWSTRSPARSSCASRQPPGVRIWWFGVQPNWAFPFPPGLAVVTWRNSSAIPLSNQLTIFLGTTSPSSGSYDKTDTGMRWLTIFPIFSWVPSARVTRVEYEKHPNITPIFSRSWLMKIAVVSNLESEPASFRMAWDISRAWRPTWESPISPSISARGTSAATESITTRSSAPERTSMSAISSACSPESGCETSSSSMSTPSARA